MVEEDELVAAKSSAESGAGGLRENSFSEIMVRSGVSSVDANTVIGLGPGGTGPYQDAARGRRDARPVGTGFTTSTRLSQKAFYRSEV